MTTAPTPTFDRLPYLTEDIQPLHAAIKRRYEDFYVEEIPAYEPVGTGNHCFFKIEKRGLATMRAVDDIARRLGIPSRRIGMAGLKDARAVTVQMLSVEHVEPKRILALEIPRIKILSVARHRNKLKIGHLRGNRFSIKLRETDLGRMADIRAICDVLVTRGVPNYFGPQRFGTRGDTWQLGLALLKRDDCTVVDLMCGRPGPGDHGDVLKARQLYDAGQYAAAARAWPYLFRDSARVCRAMDRSGGKHHQAQYAIDKRLRKFFINAYQSHLFNRVLAERINEIDRVQAGDLAYKHDSGAVFRIGCGEAEAPRAAAFEISPTGPLFGYKMTQPGGRPGEVEQALLAAEGITLEQFRNLGGMKLRGSRRPLRFRPEPLEVESGGDKHGPYIQLRFTLTAGCYATMVLREICKQHLEEGLQEESV